MMQLTSRYSAPAFATLQERTGALNGAAEELITGDRTVALPLNAFQLNADAAATGSVQTGTAPAARRDDDMRIIVTVPVEQLKSAPEFDDND